MTRVAVVIPYFQREPGILRRALETVAGQRIGDDIRLDVIVVDDESPVPPEPETRDLALAPRHRLRILRRANGGPGAARNTGLDAVEPGTDHVAFLDSDDLWEPDHLATAVAALRAGCGFFFANHAHQGRDAEGRDLDSVPFFSQLGLPWDRLLPERATPVPGRRGLYRMPGQSAVDAFLRQYLAHTSTVVFDARRFARQRFDDDLRYAGEDLFFFLCLAERSEQVGFSLDVLARRGRGVSMYEFHEDWSSPRRLHRALGNLILFLKIQARFRPQGDLAAQSRARIDRNRRGVAFLLLRNARRDLRGHLRTAWLLLRRDRMFLPSLPRNAAILLRQKRAGRLDIP